MTFESLVNVHLSCQELWFCILYCILNNNYIVWAALHFCMPSIVYTDFVLDNANITHTPQWPRIINIRLQIAFAFGESTANSLTKSKLNRNPKYVNNSLFVINKAYSTRYCRFHKQFSVVVLSGLFLSFHRDL